MQQAGNCCEYCRLMLTDMTAPFHVDHIVPRKHGGNDELDNLCFACYQYNAFKGSNMAAADPETGEAALLFHPRRQQWKEHFRVNADATLTGLTAEGHVTIAVMRINDEKRVAYRLLAMSIDEYPCQSQNV